MKILSLRVQGRTVVALNFLPKVTLSQRIKQEGCCYTRTRNYCNCLSGVAPLSQLNSATPQVDVLDSDIFGAAPARERDHQVKGHVF